MFGLLKLSVFSIWKYIGKEWKKMLIKFSQIVQTREFEREKNAYFLVYIYLNFVRSTTYTVATVQHSLKLLCKNQVIQMKNEWLKTVL